MLSPTLLTDLIHQTPARIIGAAGTVTVLVQIVKRFFPALGGWKALAFNLVCSWAATLALTTTQTFWSLATLQQLFSESNIGLMLAIAAAAAGVHGTAKSLTAGQPAAPQPAPASVPVVQKDGTVQTPGPAAPTSYSDDHVG